MKTLSLLTSTIALACAANAAQAALYYRGNGMIYDSDQNVTWLQDANYGGTLNKDVVGYAPDKYGMVAPDGGMGWSLAESWTGNLTYGGYTDWRMPKYLSPSNSELMVLFKELGNTPGQPWLNLSFVDAGTGVTYSFVNLPLTKVDEDYNTVEETRYWLQDGIWDRGTHYIGTSSFQVNPGRAYFDSVGHRNLVWVVRDGDVSQVPIPAAGWLLGSGLAGLVAARRCRKS